MTGREATGIDQPLADGEVSTRIRVLAPTADRHPPTGKRYPLGGGWEVEAKSVDDARLVSVGPPRGADGSEILSLTKMETQADYRILLRLDVPAHWRAIEIDYDATLSSPGLMQWAAVLEEAPDAGRFFLLRAKLRRPDCQSSGTIRGDVSGRQGPLFFAMQFATAPGSCTLSRLEIHDGSRGEDSLEASRGVSDHGAARRDVAPQVCRGDDLPATMLRQSEGPTPTNQEPRAASQETVIRAVEGGPGGAVDGRVIVFTCLFGGYEELKEPAATDPSVRFMAFTDDPTIRSERWEICVLRDRLSDARRTSRLPKILPHLYLPDHDFSVYLDASLTPNAVDIRKMVADCLAGREVALYRHFRRDCIFEELDTCARLNIERPHLIEFYRSHYESLRIGRHAGLFENMLIVRKDTPSVRRMNEAWWDMYRGQRDQLGLMSAIYHTGVDVAPITVGNQARNNPYATFQKHRRTPLSDDPPKVYAFIAYAPPGYGQDLGRTYNEYMNMIEEDAFAVFLDHDAMFSHDSWSEIVRDMAEGAGGKACLFIGRTNRIGNPYQRTGVLREEHRASVHTALAGWLREQHGDWMANVGPLNSSSGVILMLSKQTWRQFPFAAGFLKVDNKMHIALREAGCPVFMPAALYAYHFYRADGDQSHTLRHPTPSGEGNADRSGGLFVKNFILDERGGFNLGTYASLVADDEWAIFVRRDTIFCDRSWYARAYSRASDVRSDALVVFDNNIIHVDAPSGDDIVEHRVFAASSRSPELSELPPEHRTMSALGAFMVSGRRLRQCVEKEGVSVADLLALIKREHAPVFLDRDIYAFTQNRCGSCRDALDETRLELVAALSRNRRVAILTLGFWPAQAGMEMMIHNLAVHLDRGGDGVTLFAPKPKKPYDEIEHDYLLIRFADHYDFLRKFRDFHASLPFDVLLVQGGYEAASLALQLKEELGIAVVLRTHGEDIQVDESTGYGYRRDPAKRRIIDANIREVDRNVVIGEHVAPLITAIDPLADVRVIHNGVDVERFQPVKSDFLRDRLGLGEQHRILVTVGRNVRKKAFHLALEVFAKVREQVPEAVLVHVGKDGNGQDLGRAADNWGVSDAFYRLGELNYFEIPRAYASAELFVFTSKVETFGNVTIEAMSAGLPCIEFDYRVNRSKIDSGVNGYVVPFGDIEAHAARVVELLEDDERRERFSKAARRAAEERFAWPRIAEQYREVFRSFRACRAPHPRPTTGYGQSPVTLKSS